MNFYKLNVAVGVSFYHSVWNIVFDICGDSTSPFTLGVDVIMSYDSIGVYL